MKSYTVICFTLIWSLLTCFGQEPSMSRYGTLIFLFQTKDEEAIYSYIGGLSRDEFKDMLGEWKSDPASTSHGFEFMSMLSLPYYEYGAGKNDGYEEWARDVVDDLYPPEWRHVILGHPPARGWPQSSAQQAEFQALLYGLVLASDETPGIRREALLKLSSIVKYDSFSVTQLGEYFTCLKDIVTTPDQHVGFFRTALCEIAHVIDSAEEMAARSADPTIAKSIAVGDVVAVAGDKKIPAEQKQYLTQVAGLSKDFGAILDNLSSNTNLPNYLQKEIGKLKGKRSGPLSP